MIADWWPCFSQVCTSIKSSTLWSNPFTDTSIQSPFINWRWVCILPTDIPAISLWQAIENRTMTKKEKRIKYLGFDDKWFVIIGILTLGVSSLYIFNISLANLTTFELIISTVASLFFSTCNWLINRGILIRLRKVFPSLKDSAKRIAFFFISILITVTTVDFLGIKLISLIADMVSYYFSGTHPVIGCRPFPHHHDHGHLRSCIFLRPPQKVS